MQNQNLAPTGNLFSVYYSDPEQVKPQDMEWEVGFPVTDQVSVEPPLIKKQWTHQLVVQAVHTGSYEKTSETITEIMEWMSRHGYTQDGPILGFYLNMPGPETKSEDLKTEIWVSCKKD
jgi:effector-binding domain-containing protein